MPVYDQSYKHWEGSFKSHSFRWWVIAKYGIRMAFKKKAVRALFIFTLLPFIGFGVYVYGLTHIGKVSSFVSKLTGHSPTGLSGGKPYFVEVDGDPQPFLQKLSDKGFESWDSPPWTRRKPSDKGIQSWDSPPWIRVSAPEDENSKAILAAARETRTKIKRIVPPGARASFYNDFLNYQARFLFLLVIAVGAGLIARDVKFNALQIYLAKPITGIEYILGKLGVAVFFLVMVTLVPGVLLFLLQAIFAGDSLYFRHYWWVLGAICGYSLLIVFSGSLPVLALSALSRSVSIASLGAAAIFIFSPLIAQLLRRWTGNDNYLLVSFRDNWMSVGGKIFGLNRPFDALWGWSFLILAAIMVLSAAVLVRKVRGVEVVK